MLTGRLRRFRTAVAVLGALLVCGALVAGLAQVRRVPESRAEVEDHLERAVLAYEVIDGVPLIVAEFGGHIIHDRLTLDVISIAWPPTPRWQWTGTWDLEEPSDLPATASRSTVSPEPAVWGQVNDERIVAIEVVADGAVVSRVEMTGGGYIVVVPEGVESLRFVDGDGRVVVEVGV